MFFKIQRIPSFGGSSCGSFTISILFFLNGYPSELCGTLTPAQWWETVRRHQMSAFSYGTKWSEACDPFHNSDQSGAQTRHRHTKNGDAHTEWR